MNTATKRVVVACASFKGTLSSRLAGEAVARGLRSRGVDARVVALADGGEGLVEALAAQTPGVRLVSAKCRGPLGEQRRAEFALLAKGGASVSPAQRATAASSAQECTGEDARAALAVIEMAASSGLVCVPEARRDPKLTTTLGVGDQLLAALAYQPAEILLGIGGSATNDGGAGMAQALGARLLDAQGRELVPGGAALLRLARIDVSRLDPRLVHTPVTVACDVRNPLCGPNGASAVFGPQKGATPADVELLDAALAHFAEIIRHDLGQAVADIPGAGAAGGLGAGCVAFLKAALMPGTELVLDAVDFDGLLAGATLVITGEGQLDAQTLMGKAPAGVAARAARAGVACAAIGGGIRREDEAALKKVFARVESLSDFAGSREAALREPARWLEEWARRTDFGF